MLLAYDLPPPAIARIAQGPPPLSFIGFRAGMPVARVEARVNASGGTFTCKATTDPRMRECTGTLPFPEYQTSFDVLVSSVGDSVAVMVLTTHVFEGVASEWVLAVTEDFGRPNQEEKPGTLRSWQWIRKGQMLRVLERTVSNEPRRAVSVTLTDGPLLDGLGPPQRKKPG